jgi:DNA replication protein DnaC
VFFNILAPSSTFICGSQGSGKSHTLSCLLENCLMKSDVSTLENPLAGLLFHYDSFTSDVKGTPCEAAHLASNSNIKVRVLCSPTNLEMAKVISIFHSQ